MSLLAWIVVAAILIAWLIEATLQHIDRRRDERDWQAAVEEAEAAASKWHSAYRAMERGSNEMRRKAARLQDELDHSRRTIAAVTMHAERHRVAERATVTPIKKARPKKAAGGAVSR